MSSNNKSEEERKRLVPSGQNKLPTGNEDDIEAGIDDAEDKKGSTLIIAFVAMLVFQLGNRIYGRLQTYPMHNYPLFLNMLMIVVYIPICFAYIIPAIAYTNNISQEQRDIPKYKFAVMGGYDSLAGIMQTFAVNYVSNASMIVLVQQSAIPISMIISRYALQSVYSTAQYIGAGVVLMGIVVVLIPNFFFTAETTSSSTAASATAESPTAQLIWLLILVISCVPMCLSSVYKEKALGEMEIDVFYLNGWVAVFQFLIAIPLCLPTSQIQDIPLADIMPNMYDGMSCWMGYNSITAEHNPHNLPLDDCSSAPYYVTIYLFFNVVYNYLIVIILKLGSANILWMASTVIVPLSNVAFSMKWMPGHKPLKFWDLIGLMVIMIGLVIYRFSKDLLGLTQKLLTICGLRKPTFDDDEGDEVDVPSDGAEALQKKKRHISKKAERKQLKYSGINQMEYLQTLVDTRVLREEQSMTAKLLFRSPRQIRSTFFAKIGVPPSPLIAMTGRRPSLAGLVDGGNGNGGSGNGTPTMTAGSSSNGSYSPLMLGTMKNKNLSFRAPNASSSSSTTARMMMGAPLAPPASSNGNNNNAAYYTSRSNSGPGGGSSGNGSNNNNNNSNNNNYGSTNSSGGGIVAASGTTPSKIPQPIGRNTAAARDK